MKFNSRPIGNFPSQLEANVYLTLSGYFTPTEITRQVSIKLTPSISWKVDFTITQDDRLLYVEAKGLATDEFKLKLRLLNDFHFEIAQKLILVAANASSAKQLKKLHYRAIPLIDLPDFLRSIGFYNSKTKEVG